MKKPNIAVIYGGGGKEHDISILTSKYIIQNLQEIKIYNVIPLILNKDYQLHTESGDHVFIGPNKTLITLENKSYINTDTKIDFVIPVFHGTPGETGEYQAFLKLHNIPFLGCNTEANILSMNKITTKLWLEHAHIPTTPFIYLSNESEENDQYAEAFFKKHTDIFIKASSEGSAIGIYHCTQEQDLKKYIKQAFSYSNQVLIEKTIQGRELEIACFEYDGKLIVTKPGEIICSKGFYNFEEKYDTSSTTQTEIVAKNIPEEIETKLISYATSAYKIMGLKDLSRIDFFLSEDNQIYLNEINTFPGMTPISMFPKMMEEAGISFSEYLKDRINQTLK